MRDIVATVQAEQDEIIRAPLTGVLVVQGGPGTGKTAVALHRAAYLLYTHRVPARAPGRARRGAQPPLPPLHRAGAAVARRDGCRAGHARVAAARCRRPTGTEPLDGGAPQGRRAHGRGRAPRRFAIASGRCTHDLDVPFGRRVLRVAAADTAAIVARSLAAGPGPHNGRRRLVERLLFERFHEAVAAHRRRRGGCTVDDAAPRRCGASRPSSRRSSACGRCSRRWSCCTISSAPARCSSWPRARCVPEERDALYRPRSPSVDDVAWTPADIALLDEARARLGPGARQRGAAHVRAHRRRRGPGPLADAAAHARPAVAVGLDDRGRRPGPGHRHLGRARGGTTSCGTSSPSAAGSWSA